ncbi:hypothetical protein SLS58_002743 [Diplodia intermedia]|uniref:Uncharacterized protein n=1 Tax=Diplodia intermedia TaxID=856260 RepID=A0ABR3TYC1_9PEZI
MNAYDVYFATPGFEKGEPYERYLFPDKHDTSYHDIDYFYDPYYSSYLASSYFTNPSLIQEKAQYFEHLSNADCMKRYGEEFVSDRRNLILVVAENTSRTMSWTNTDVGGIGGPGEHNDVDHTERCNSTSFSAELLTIPLGYMNLACLHNTSLLAVGSYANKVIATSGINRPDAYYWVCSHDRYSRTDMCSSHLSDLRADEESWTVYGMPIEYCLSERVEPQCSFNVNLNLLTVVIIFNLIKVSCIALVVLRIKDKPLITVGDAVATFIEEPDDTTRGLCLINRGMVVGQHWNKRRNALISTPDTYKLEHVRWYKAASKRRWLSSFFTITVGVGAILALLAYAISDLRRRGDSDLKHLWELGLGKIHSATLIQGWAIPTTGDSAITGTVLIANLPQALLSFIYLMLNGLCTNMLLAFEWSKFSAARRTLRVSEPRGAQRSTYFLQIPYRYGIPLTVLSSLLHWLVSQSIFLAKVDGLDPRGGRTPVGNVTTCGYSPFGMIFTTMGGLLLVIFAVALGFRKLKPGMPLAGSCSIAISAACHVPEGTSELEPLMWGVVPKHPDDVHSGVGHCSFANECVDKPLSGILYA